MPYSPEQILELALKSGAEAAEVFESQSQSHPVSFEANRLKQLESTEASGLALRLWRQGRPGLAIAYGDVEPQALVERAFALSDLNLPEDIELSPPQPLPHPDLGQDVPVETLLAWGEQSIAQVRQRYPEVLCNAGWDCEAESTRLINSYGLDCHYRDTTLSGYLEVEWIRGDDFLVVADGQTARSQLQPEIFVQRILQGLAWAEEHAEPPAPRVPVLLSAKAADLLWGTTYAALNGKQVLEKASPWSEHLGKMVMAPNLSISQAPDVGPFNCPFDDEGMPTQPITFIDQGTLCSFYTDRVTGKALGCGTTGNGFRPDLGAYPTPGLFNVLIQPGQYSLANLIASMDDGLIVDQVLGGGAGISGDFSVNVDLGYRVHQGQVVGRVKDTMLAGNVYTVLKTVIALGNDSEWNGCCWTPSVLVEGLSVTS
jgi:PmbA protein